MSSREVIERLRKRRVIAEVQTSEGTLYVRGINGRERVAYFDWLGGDGRGGNILLSDHRLLAMALCEQDGTPLFQGEGEALEALQDLSHDDIQAAAKKVLSLSGLSKDSAEDAAKK